VKSVELVTGQAKPSAMDALNPIMRENEDQEPNQQYSVIDDRTPQKKVACYFNAHLLLASASNESVVNRRAAITLAK
jgi:hypothetical protein